MDGCVQASVAGQLSEASIGCSDRYYIRHESPSRPRTTVGISPERTRLGRGGGLRKHLIYCCRSVNDIRLATVTTTRETGSEGRCFGW